jgi:hypothetical protein
MSRTPSKKMAAENAAPPKMHSWAIRRLKGTPAALLGHVEAPDAETAIKKGIGEFKIDPAFHKRLIAQRTVLTKDEARRIAVNVALYLILN